MTNKITCPYCNKSFEPTDAYKHELEEKLLRESQEKHNEELGKLRREKKDLEDAKEKEIVEVKKQAIEKATLAAQERVAKQLKDKEDQALEYKKRAEHAEELELQIRKKMRELEESKRKFELEKQRQLDEEREKIRTDARKEAQEGMSLNLAQEKKKNDDAQKQILELQRKLQQGSQQAQGEVMELELEELLKREFPLDKVVEVQKGQRGADVVQEVIDKKGRNCGVILWESKNAKWQNTWIATLKENQRQAKAQIAVLVVNNPPPEIESFVYKQGVWIASRKMALPLALALRYDLARVTFEKMANINKSEKAEILYQYITSTEFKHRIEAIAETFTDMQRTMETEKRWFTSKWAKQEKQIRRVVDNTIGMRSDLEELVGNALPSVDHLELPNSIEEGETK
ncbi:MAG: hypothetical protein COU69_02310 [Candidatus Pacebacteria bacterium CG10_big_fil_rev_8_21_14_0_10_56_10]|nr:MAG: hypothetical protein COU69_02310 [Candidatus Pacebacteria bacterium CG10_big_fil_rev_8_21_14_0_10_56_10]